jgi:hypothetical protein
MNATATGTKSFRYSQQFGWQDCQTNRWISSRTVADRTGLPLSHIVDFENGRDGYGYKMNKADRFAAEAKAGVELR